MIGVISSGEAAHPGSGVAQLYFCGDCAYADHITTYIQVERNFNMSIGDSITLVSCLAGLMAALPGLMIFLNMGFFVFILGLKE